MLLVLYVSLLYEIKVYKHRAVSQRAVCIPPTWVFLGFHTEYITGDNLRHVSGLSRFIQCHNCWVAWNTPDARAAGCCGQP